MEQIHKDNRLEILQAQDHWDTKSSVLFVMKLDLAKHVILMVLSEYGNLLKNEGLELLLILK